MFVQTLWEPGHVLCSVCFYFTCKFLVKERKQRLSFTGSLLGLLFIPGEAVKQDLYPNKTAGTLAGEGRTHQGFSDVSQIPKFLSKSMEGMDMMDMTFYLGAKSAEP